MSPALGLSSIGTPAFPFSHGLSYVSEPYTEGHPNPPLFMSLERPSDLTSPSLSHPPWGHRSERSIASMNPYSFGAPATTDLSTGHHSYNFLNAPLKGPSDSTGSTSDHSTRDHPFGLDPIDDKDGSAFAHTLIPQPLNTGVTPERPMDAFTIFARKRRPEVSATNKTMGTGEISELLSKEWNTMDIVSRF